MEQFDLKKLDVAIKYVERITEGLNPVNNQPVGNDEAMMNPNVIRCMQFIKQVLESVRENDGVINGKARCEEMKPFPIEALDLFQYQEDKSIKHVLEQIYKPVEKMNVKRISVMTVNACLRDEGYLADVIHPETGRARKVLTEKGKSIGIYEVEKFYDGNSYQAILYNKNAQEFVVKKLREMLSK